jgi:hypothetical protein
MTDRGDIPKRYRWIDTFPTLTPTQQHQLDLLALENPEAHVVGWHLGARGPILQLVKGGCPFFLTRRGILRLVPR